jgi:hypothetical protein
MEMEMDPDPVTGTCAPARTRGICANRYKEKETMVTTRLVNERWRKVSSLWWRLCMYIYVSYQRCTEMSSGCPAGAAV